VRINVPLKLWGVEKLAMAEMANKRYMDPRPACKAEVGLRVGEMKSIVT
jgi:hypothetical protein